MQNTFLVVCVYLNIKHVRVNYAYSCSNGNSYTYVYLKKKKTPFSHKDPLEILINRQVNNHIFYFISFVAIQDKIMSQGDMLIGEQNPRKFYSACESATLQPHLLHK